MTDTTKKTLNEPAKFRSVALATETIALEVLHLLPFATAQQYRAIVFRDSEIDGKRTVSLAAEDPSSDTIRGLARYLEDKNHVAVDIYQSQSSDIDTQLARYQQAEQTQGQEVKEPISVMQKDIATKQDLDAVIQQAVIPNIVTAIINFALTKKASDIHLEPLEDVVRIRFRLDGNLVDIANIPRFFRNAVTARIKILAQMKLDESRIPQDGRFEFDYHSHTIDLRISTLPTVQGEKIVMRLLDKDAGVMTLEELGITGSSFDALVRAVSRPYGVVLATGPTGSGKTTTLYAILQRIAHPDTNVVTLEDPVEYEIPGVNQSQVKPSIGYTFAEGLRAVLRQDPNVIMVGEIRDLETASMVTHAALTGHLVVSTLHTNDAAGALPRLMNIGVEPYLLTSAVNAIIGQRLVRKLCIACRRQMELPKALIEEVRAELNSLKGFPISNQTDYVFYQAVGCAQCVDGYSGRIGIYEVLTMNETVESLALARRPSSELSEAAKQSGMITLRQDGILKAIKGITSIEEVWRVTSEA